MSIVRQMLQEGSCLSNRDLLSCRTMQAPSEVMTRPLEVVSDQTAIEKVEMRTVRLPLNEPFETSFGSIDSRLIFLVSVEADGLTGWGEVVAAEEPRYSYETVGTAWHVIRDYLAPAMLFRPVAGLACP